MKFYYSTATCSTAVHIALEEAGLPFTPVEVSWSRNLNVDELDKLSELGAVPVMVMDDGKVVTQNAALLEYIGDQKPEKNLIAKPGTTERALVMSWLSFVAADFQKAFNFGAIEDMTSDEKAQEQITAFSKKKLNGLLKYIDNKLTGKQFITGDKYTVADCYLFTIMGWTKWNEVETKEFKNISSYMKRVFERPAVQKVLKSEDLLEDYGQF